MEILNLAYHEHRLIIRALEKNKGRKADSAKDLKISSRTLFRKMKEYKIQTDDYMDEKPREGREALSTQYQNEYFKIISYINTHNDFWVKDLKQYMGYDSYYSPATHLVDYLRTKNIIQCIETKNRGMKYRATRVIVSGDLTFVKGNGVKASRPS